MSFAPRDILFSLRNFPVLGSLHGPSRHLIRREGASTLLSSVESRDFSYYATRINVSVIFNNVISRLCIYRVRICILNFDRAKNALPPIAGLQF